MTMHSACGWCDNMPHRTGGKMVCAHCDNAAPVVDWCRRQRSLRLAHELQLAIERGRRLHPWVDADTQLDALKDECDELLAELGVRQVDTQRVVSEAIDVFVTALRLREGG